MARPALEVADILRDHGPAWREANRGHVSLEQLKVMNAIERCRTAALGGHVARCENTACGHTEISYNSCGNRHCPKCQGAASRRWLAEREAELLPVPYFHVVYRRRRVEVLQHPRRTCRQENVQALHRPAAAYQVAGLLQGAIRRARAGAALSLPLHPSGRHLEPPPRCSRQRSDCVPLQGLSRQRLRPLEDDAAPAARVHQTLPAARATQGLPPHPPLRALCFHQPRREHRDGPRTPQCRPACRRPATAAGCGAGYPACAAVPMRALRRTHDRHRNLRARRPAELSAYTDHDRHLISQSSWKRCGFPAPTRWLNAGGNLTRTNRIHQTVDHALTRSEHPSKCLSHSPDLPCDHPCRWPRAGVLPIIEIGANI